MLSEISFEKCSKKDIDILTTISQSFYPEHYAHIWQNQDPSFYLNLSFSKKAFEKDFNIENIIYYLIKKDDIHLGLLKIRKDELVQDYTNNEALQLEKIYLLQSSTGLGIGKKAMKFIIEYARSINKKVVWLDVMTTSKALDFYKKIGFVTVYHYELDYPGLKDGYRGMQRMILKL